MSTRMNNMFLIIRMRVLKAFKKISMQELSLLVYHVERAAFYRQA
jgi:hypothetical protein